MLTPSLPPALFKLLLAWLSELLLAGLSELLLARLSELLLALLSELLLAWLSELLVPWLSELDRSIREGVGRPNWGPDAPFPGREKICKTPKLAEALAIFWQITVEGGRRRCLGAVARDDS